MGHYFPMLVAFRHDLDIQFVHLAAGVHIHGLAVRKDNHPVEDIVAAVVVDNQDSEHVVVVDMLPDIGFAGEEGLAAAAVGALVDLVAPGVVAMSPDQEEEHPELVYPN